MVGRVWLTDNGTSFTAKAIETISGGQLVKAVSGATVLSSTNFIQDACEVALVDTAADNNRFVGVALETGVSGDYIGVATEGIFGFYVAPATLEAGSVVQAAGAVTSADAVDVFGVTSNSGAVLRIGRALSEAASGQLIAVKLGG